jgi:hypothetical protein
MPIYSNECVAWMKRSEIQDLPDFGLTASGLRSFYSRINNILIFKE